MNDKKFDSGQLLMLVASILLAGFIAWLPGDGTAKLKLAVGYAVLVVVFLLGMSVVVAIVRGQIDLSELIEEMNGGASASRFQLLVFTFVIALGFLYLTISSGTSGKAPAFPSIPAEVLTLLGLSATTYGVSKGIQVSSGQTGGDATNAPPDKDEAAKAAGAGRE